MSSSIFLTPGLNLMQRLTFRYKILSLGILFIIPVIWLTTLYILDNTKVIQFTEKERVGLVHLKTVYPIIQFVAKTRGLTNTYLSGSKGIKNKITESRSKVNSAFEVLAASEKKVSSELILTIRVDSLKSKWLTLSNSALQKPAKDGFVAYTNFIEELHKYILHIADNSNLILDPELDSYYLMDTVVVQLPELSDRIGQGRGLGAGVAAKKQFTPEEFTSITSIINEIDLFGNSVSSGLMKVYNHTAELKSIIQISEDNFNKKWKSFTRLSNNKLINPDTIKIDSSKYFNAGTEALNEAEILLNTLLPVLDGLLEKRIADKTFMLYQTVIMIIVVLFLVGYLFFAFSISVQSNMNKINSTLTLLAQGEFQVKADVYAKDEIGEAANNLNVMIEKIRDLISQVINSANQVSTAAEQTSATAAQAQDGINRQNSEIEQVATAINEMSATVHEVAQNTSSAAELTQVADAESVNGQQVVNEAIGSINSLADSMQSSSVIIHDLETQSEGIGAVIDVIRGIAEQTNLLALNAAIEAARAGEQGRGFAVVADEVRSLASRTQESTQEINDMVGKLQSGARNAVEAMVQGSTQTEQSVEQVVQAGAALDQISSAVTTIRDMNTQIASAAEEQSSVSEEINRNIVNIRDIAEATVEGANLTAQNSETMSRTASELIELVNEFKV